MPASGSVRTPYRSHDGAAAAQAQASAKLSRRSSHYAIASRAFRASPEPARQLRWQPSATVQNAVATPSRDSRPHRRLPANCGKPGSPPTRSRASLPEAAPARPIPASRHLYMLDESSPASTRQMGDFLDKIAPQDRVLVIGDTVTGVHADTSRLTVRREDGREVTYDPKRLQGARTYQEIGREFSKGGRRPDSVHCSVPQARCCKPRARHRGEDHRRRRQRSPGRKAGPGCDLRCLKKLRHFDHGYALTSHSSQGVTADRVLVNIDTRSHPELVNTRFAYVGVSRASLDTQTYTKDAAALA